MMIGKEACSNFLGEINKYPKGKQLQFIKRTEWIPSHIVKRAPISRTLTFYTDANKLGLAGYKAGNIRKAIQSPYDSLKKSKLYAILMVLLDSNESLNIITDSQYAERVVLHIETVEHIPDNSKLILIFMQLQQAIQDKN